MNPRGTVRARMGEAGELDSTFRRLGLGARRCDLGDEGLYLAEELVAADRWLGGDDPEALGILVLALMIAQHQGSTRLPLDPKGDLRALVDAIVRAAELPLEPSRIVKRILALTTSPRFGSVLGSGDARVPLVIDDNCLYSERSRWLERRVATRLTQKLGDALNFRYFPSQACETLSESQRRAVDLALSGALTVITGGPGTGKTKVAAAILREFRARGLAHVALAAPTGKAANRLTEVLAREGVDAPPAQTLHRLLGYRGHGFAHHAKSPLPVDALIVDEASMIDLELVDALLDALPARAPLVLVGDAHQLPAIGAGRILADLVDLSSATLRVAARPGEAGAFELGTRVVTLDHSYRMDSSDPRGRAIYETARAIHAGDAQRLVDRSQPLATPRTPQSLAFAGVEWIDSARTPDAARAITAAVWHHFDGPRAQDLANTHVFRFTDGRIAPAQAHALDELWQLAQRARILTVTRALPTGTIALNAYLHDLALARTTTTTRPDFIPGEPVMITANDYERGLYNGDQGLVIRADEGVDRSSRLGSRDDLYGRAGHHRYRAVFRVAGELRPFAIEALRDRLELAWALTVHKSQGSELDAVALVLPDDDLPLVTRELLYTGITRARTSVALCGTRAALIAGGKRSALRHSGLAARIRATLPR